MRASTSAHLHVAFLLGCLALVASACGDPDAKSEGEQCFASSECGPGLTCDFGMSPSLCRPSQTPLPDAMDVVIDASLVDADPNLPDAAPLPDARRLPDAAPGAPDAAVADAAVPDAAIPDAAVADAAVPDAAAPDATM